MVYKVKAVVFDLFGTLTTFIDPEAVIIKTFGIKIQKPEVQKLVCGQVYKDEESYFKNIAEGLGIKDIERLKEILKQEQVDMTVIQPEAASVLDALKKNGYKLGLISNSWPHGSEKFNYLKNYFDSMILSHKIGMLKPDAKMFETCLKELGVKADEAVMIGNSYESDIAPAEAVGMKGILIDREGNYLDKESIKKLNELLDKIELIK